MKGYWLQTYGTSLKKGNNSRTFSRCNVTETEERAANREKDKDVKRSARRDRNHFTKQPAEKAKAAAKRKDTRTVYTKAHHIGRRRDTKQEQAEFRKGKSCIDQIFIHVFVLRQILEQSSV